MKRYNVLDADFIRYELNDGKKDILITEPIDTRAIDAVCKEKGIGHYIRDAKNKIIFIPHYYWNLKSRNEFHIRFW